MYTSQMPTVEIPFAATFPSVAESVSKTTQVAAENTVGIDAAATEAAKIASNVNWKGVATKAGIAAVILALAGCGYVFYRGYFQKSGMPNAAAVEMAQANVDLMMKVAQLEEENKRLKASISGE